MEFKLNEAESKAAEKFMQEHRHSDVYKDNTGGYINFIFTPTSIGDIITIECLACDKREDITDYSVW